MQVRFAQTLSQLRHEKGVSQRQAAQALEVSQALLSHYENGIREPGLAFVVRACDYYQVSADYLLGMTDELTPHAAPKSDTGNGWQTGTDYPDGMILAVFCFPGSDDIRQLMYAKDGKLYFSRKYTTRAEEQPVLWLAIPAIPEKAKVYAED